MSSRSTDHDGSSSSRFIQRDDTWIPSDPRLGQLQIAHSGLDPQFFHPERRIFTGSIATTVYDPMTTGSYYHATAACNRSDVAGGAATSFDYSYTFTGPEYGDVATGFSAAVHRSVASSEPGIVWYVNKQFETTEQLAIPIVLRSSRSEALVPRRTPKEQSRLMRKFLLEPGTKESEAHFAESQGIELETDKIIKSFLSEIKPFVEARFGSWKAWAGSYSGPDAMRRMVDSICLQLSSKSKTDIGSYEFHYRDEDPPALEAWEKWW